MVEESALNPAVEQRMAAAEEMQAHWQFVLDLLDGEITEATRHGWDPSQARMLVFATYMSTMMSPIMGNG